MIRDVFSQPHQAMVMLFFGLMGGFGYELVRLPRLRAGRLGALLWDILALILLQGCLFAGLLLSPRGGTSLWTVPLLRRDGHRSLGHSTPVHRNTSKDMQKTVPLPLKV